METGKADFFTKFVRLSTAAMLCLCTGNAASVPEETSPIQIEIARLRELDDAQPAAALKQMSALQQQLAPDTAPADRREVLIALIPMVLDVGQKDQARSLTEKLAAHGQQHRDEFASTMAKSFEASLLSGEGKVGEAIEVIEIALTMAKRVGTRRILHRVNSTAGSLYSNRGDFEAALRHQLIALDALEDGGRQADLRRINTWNNISTLYLSLKDPQMALDYLAKAGVLAETIGAQSILASLSLNRGYAYADQGKHKEAAAAYAESLAIARKIGERQSEAVALTNLADAALTLHNYPECVRHAQQSIALAEQLGNHDVAASGYSNLGLCHMGMGAVAQGASEVKRGIDFFRKAQARPAIELALGELATAYEKAGMYKDAVSAMREQRTLAEELFHAKRDRAVSELTARFDASQRQKQIEVLEQKSRLQQIEIENKRLQRIAATLATIVALIAAMSILLLYRKVRASNLRLRETNVKLKHQSTRDPLTGLLNRRAFQDIMVNLGHAPERRLPDQKSLPNALILLDIDHFKHINDTHGHAAGDAVLVELGKRLSQIMREHDLLMRWGGEEFLIFLHHVPGEFLTQVVERVLSVVGGSTVAHGAEAIPVTTSAGFIPLPLPGTNETELNWEKALNLADTALYMAKTHGRNQAIGIESIQVPLAQVSELLEHDFEAALQKGMVSISHIAGPRATTHEASPDS